MMRKRLAFSTFWITERTAAESSTTSTRLGSRTAMQFSIRLAACCCSIGFDSVQSTSRPGTSPIATASGRPGSPRTAATSACIACAGIVESNSTASKASAAIAFSDAVASPAASISVTITGIDAPAMARRISSRSPAASDTIIALSETNSSVIQPQCNAAACTQGVALDGQCPRLSWIKSRPRGLAQAQVVVRGAINQPEFLWNSRQSGAHAGGKASWNFTASPVEGPVSSPCHITLRPRTKVPTGQPVTVTPL